MNETNKFYDYAGDWVQAVDNGCEAIEIVTEGQPELIPEQAIEFAKQLTELAQEVKGNEHS